MAAKSSRPSRAGSSSRERNHLPYPYMVPGTIGQELSVQHVCSYPVMSTRYLVPGTGTSKIIVVTCTPGQSQHDPRGPTCYSTWVPGARTACHDGRRPIGHIGLYWISSYRVQVRHKYRYRYWDPVPGTGTVDFAAKGALADIAPKDAACGDRRSPEGRVDGRR